MADAALEDRADAAGQGRRRAVVTGARVVMLALALVTGSAAVASAHAAHAGDAVLVGVPSPTATEAPRAIVPDHR